MFLFIKIFLLWKSIISILCGNLVNEKVLYYDIELKITESKDENKKLETTVNNFFKKLPENFSCGIFNGEKKSSKDENFYKMFPESIKNSIEKISKEPTFNAKMLYIFMKDDLHIFFSEEKKIYFYNDDTFYLCNFQSLKNQIEEDNQFSFIIEKYILLLIHFYLFKNSDFIEDSKFKFNLHSIELKSNPYGLKKLFLFIIYRLCYFMKTINFPDKMYHDYFYTFFNEESSDMKLIFSKFSEKSLLNQNDQEKIISFHNTLNTCDIKNIKNIYVSECDSKIIISDHFQSSLNYKKINKKLCEILSLAKDHLKNKKTIGLKIEIDCTSFFERYFEILNIIIQKNISPKDFCCEILQNFNMDKKIISELINNLLSLIKFAYQNTNIVDSNNILNNKSYLTIKINYINENILKDKKEANLIFKEYNLTIREFINKNLNSIFDTMQICFEDLKNRFMLLDDFLNKNKKLELIKSSSDQQTEPKISEYEPILLSLFKQKQNILYDELQTKIKNIKFVDNEKISCVGILPGLEPSDNKQSNSAVFNYSDLASKKQTINYDLNNSEHNETESLENNNNEEKKAPTSKFENYTASVTETENFFNNPINNDIIALVLLNHQLVQQQIL